MAAPDPSGPDPPELGPRALEALLAFWADAGVAAMLAAAPVDRLAAPPSAPSPERTRPPTREAAAESASASAPLAAPDFAALEAAVAAFEGCALRTAGAARAVFAHIPARTDVVVVAEAPGAEAEPFGGEAGALVRTLLRHAGLAERAVLTQTVFWRPPGGASPSAADQAACLPFLERLIALARPRALLIMGESAQRGLLGADAGPILKSRGSWATWTARHEALSLPALPTLSPAFILARPAMRKATWGDIVSLAARVDAPDAPA